MRRLRFHTLDVFTDRPFGGNPLAVFPEASGLSVGQMSTLARELNLSETVFVLPPESAAGTRRLRIFTPTRELPFAGHPTVGTAILLAELGAVQVPDAGEVVAVLEEQTGPVPVKIRRERGGLLVAQLTAAALPEERKSPVDDTTLATMLSLSPEDFIGGDWAPAGVSAGVPYLLVPLRDRAAVRRARLDHELWARHLAGTWAEHVYAFAMDPELAGSHVRARMFAPALGIPEDPATGAAAVDLAGYLAMRDERADGVRRWRIEQGFEMGRPSLLDAEAELRSGQISALRVGGTAVPVLDAEIRVPEDG